jgi:hypoxanthine phosphoribosyltransferase
MNKKTYTWKQFDNDIKNLVRRIKYANYQPATIVALARGGLCLGVKLSHALGAPLMIVSCKSYTEQKKQASMVLLNSSYTVPLKSPVLLIDEVADSGRTLQVVKDHFESLGVEIKIATLSYKRHSVVKPDWFMKQIKNDTWMVYPWET